MLKSRSVLVRVSPLMSVPVRSVNGMPLRMKILGLSVMSAKAREAKLCPGPALNGLCRTPLTTKLWRLSQVDSDRAVQSRDGEGGAKRELKSVLSSIALLQG